MSVYINGTGIISAQQTYDKSILKNGFVTYEGNRMACREPDYSMYIDGKQIRRMSRIIRMGIVSSLLATREAGVEKPDAIIVGTAFGCLEDTYSFLSKLVQYREDMLSPTAFIHSTHNTIAAQIALLFQCRGYNSTYVHRALSFESALCDAMLLLDEGDVKNVLLGGIDEMTNAGFTIMDRLGYYKPADVTGGNFYSEGQKGSVAGEGASFFSVSQNQTNTSYAKIAGLEMLSFMNTDEVISRTYELLHANSIEKPDLIITGHNGDKNNDQFNTMFVNAISSQDRILRYKHWCGEYATSTAFATWLGAEILKNNFALENLSGILPSDKKLNNLLIYNQQDGAHHSLILLQAC